jgi:hypothetical protein
MLLFSIPTVNYIGSSYILWYFFAIFTILCMVHAHWLFLLLKGGIGSAIHQPLLDFPHPNLLATSSPFAMSEENGFSASIACWLEWIFNGQLLIPACYRSRQKVTSGGHLSLSCTVSNPIAHYFNGMYLPQTTTSAHLTPVL